MIHWELCKTLKFDHTTKWYRHKPESVQDNETWKIFCDFEKHIESPNDNQMTKLWWLSKTENLLSRGFWRFGEQLRENQRKRKQIEEHRSRQRTEIMWNKRVAVIAGSCKGGWKCKKPEDKPRPCKLEQDRSKCYEESLRPEETCCLSDSI